MVVRGEVLISYPNFEKINTEIVNPNDKYKNPRNLASSSLRLLDSSIAAKRHLHFRAFEVVYPVLKTVADSLDWLDTMRIDHVAFWKVNAATIFNVIEILENIINKNLLDDPTDGLVLTYDDVAYGKSLGTTESFQNIPLLLSGRMML